jgi:hypothetical protein
VELHIVEDQMNAHNTVPGVKHFVILGQSSLTSAGQALQISAAYLLLSMTLHTVVVGL